MVAEHRRFEEIEDRFECLPLPEAIALLRAIKESDHAYAEARATALEDYPRRFRGSARPPVVKAVRRRPMAMNRDSHEARSMRRIAAPVRAAAHFYR